MFRISKLDWTQQFYFNNRYGTAKSVDSGSSGKTRLERRATIEKDSLESALEHMIRDIEIFNKRFRFKIHRKTGEIVVQVIDSKTKKVIREIPPKELVELHARLRELASEAGLKEKKEEIWG